MKVLRTNSDLDDNVYDEYAERDVVPLKSLVNEIFY